METRQVTEIRIWKLVLNPMTANTEISKIVAFSDDKEKLIDWYKDQYADEPYYSVGDNYFPAKGDFSENVIKGQRFYKVFKKDSLLEWMNPLSDVNVVNHHHQGITDEWVRESDIQHTPLLKV